MKIYRKPAFRKIHSCWIIGQGKSFLLILSTGIRITIISNLIMKLLIQTAVKPQAFSGWIMRAVKYWLQMKKSNDLLNNYFITAVLC